MAAAELMTSVVHIMDKNVRCADFSLCHIVVLKAMLKIETPRFRVRPVNQTANVCCEKLSSFIHSCAGIGTNVGLCDRY